MGKFFVKKESNLFNVIIVETEVSFHGSQLSFDNNFEVILEDVELSDLRNFVTRFDYGYAERKLNLADESIVFNLEFVRCRIKNQSHEQRIDFRGRKISFANCLFDEGSFGLRFKQLTLTVTGLDNGSLAIDQDLRVYSSGVTINFAQGVEIITKANEQSCFVFNPEKYLQLLGGYFESIKVGGIDFNLSTPTSCSVKFLNIGKKYEFKEFVSSTNTKIATGENRLNLSLISNLKSLVVNDVRLNEFICENCDLSKSYMYFDGDSSLNFKNFQSIASTWNPSTMNYRGFFPTMDLSDVRDKKVNVLPAREFFCEIKTHFSERGDSITAGEFYAAEMKAHRAYLSQTKWLLHPDRLTMFFSYSASNFGQNWLRALFWYGLIGLIVAQIILLSSKRLCCFDQGQFYAHIFSPLTIDFSDVRKGLLISSWYSFLWIIWKITAGYLIYQIIISTRRFIRKW